MHTTSILGEGSERRNSSRKYLFVLYFLDFVKVLNTSGAEK